MKKKKGGKKGDSNFPDIDLPCQAGMHIHQSLALICYLTFCDELKAKQHRWIVLSFEEQNVPGTEFSSTFNVKLTLRLKEHLLKEREREKRDSKGLLGVQY